MNARQLRIGRTLLAAWYCWQQTFDFIEESAHSANAALTIIATFSAEDHPKRTENSPEGIGIMKLVSLNVARPQLIVYQGKTISTGIFKQPVSGAVQLRSLNFEEDSQADLSVHGGPYKAVYAYPSEHYAFWQEELTTTHLPWGMFGENLTTEGLFEADLHIGDRLGIGTAVVTVRQPRTPCYKLVAKFQRTDMLERFLRSGRSGFYFSVEKEGVVQSGDSFDTLTHEPEAVSIAEMNRLFVADKYDKRLLEKAIATPALPEDWREYLAQRLSGVAAVED